MTEANSLLIRCENSRRSNRASDEYCSVDVFSIMCIMLHPLRPGYFQDKMLRRCLRL